MNAMKLFSWFNKPQHDLDKSIDNLHQLIETHKNRYAELAVRNDYLQERVNRLETLEKDIQARETSLPSYVVNFKLLNAFSVEKQFDDKGNGYTTIGWLDKDGHAQEWSLYCNQDAHEALVTKFKHGVL